MYHACCNRRPVAQHGHCMEYVHGLQYLLGNLMFIVGSFCYFPAVSQWANTGTWIYFIFSLQNLLLALWELHESVAAQRQILKVWRKDALIRDDLLEVASFIVSGFLFTLGTFFMLPVAGVFSDLASDWFSVIGSFALIPASFFNAMAMVADRTEKGVPSHVEARLFLIHASGLFCGLVGGVFFLGGALMYLKPLEDNLYALNFGTWLYVLGSVLFFMQSALSLISTFAAHSESMEYDPSSSSSSSRDSTGLQMARRESASGEVAFDV